MIKFPSDIRGMASLELPENWQELWASTWSLEEKEEACRRLSHSERKGVACPVKSAALVAMLVEDARQYKDSFDSACPIASFYPSYNQAQILNAWHPAFEPDEAPTGYRSVLIFLENRGGKTTAVVIDTLLWMIPNDPAWAMFQPMEDEFGRGTYTVLPRPEWATWKATGKMILPWLKGPPKAGRHCSIWHGVPDRSHWEQVVGAEYRKWIPSYEIATRGPKNEEDWNKTEMYFKTRWGHIVYGKLYGSDTLAWSGKACWRVNFDEGMDKATLGEALPRVQSEGSLYWAYTPAEARNTGRRTQLAFQCYQGKYPLVGKVKSFTDLGGIDTIPDRIMPAAKKADDKARYAKMGAEGKVRARGGFFTSSPLVFNHFEREFHVLPMDSREAIEKWGGVANFFRGIDEGIAHPAACVWAMLLPTGEWILYRDYKITNRSISERVKDIVEASGNELTETKTIGPDNQVAMRYKERYVREKFRATLADWHLWNRKNESLRDSRADDYRKAGMLIRKSTQLGPAARCDNVNDLMRKDHTRLHLLTGYAPGTRLYVTRNCGDVIERMENYLQAQYSSGQNAGEFKGNPDELGDDIPDAFCYALLGGFRWIPPADIFGIGVDGDGNDLQSSTDTAFNPITGYQSISR